MLIHSPFSNILIFDEEEEPTFWSQTELTFPEGFLILFKHFYLFSYILLVSVSYVKALLSPLHWPVTSHMD